MKKLLLATLVAGLSLYLAACTPVDAELARLEARAAEVTIIRDDSGIAHIHGQTDADAVFGMIYAQAEDDFNRIEVNFLNAMGRLSEAEGEGQIWRDLRMKLFIAPDDMRAQYDEAPVWLQSLMDAWADGLNYYLDTHPEVAPRVLTYFEPWMALTFSEGSIGGDIERVNIGRLEDFYGGSPMAEAVVDVEDDRFREPSGSNGFAIAPENSATGNALLLINPHTSFFFRSELHMTSSEGLNAYGAVTWGQFFVYQGFNETAGWMHTSSGVDNIDEYLETIVERDDAFYYVYGDEERPVTTEQITIPYKTDTGMAEREFTVYRTHHGPVVRAVDDKWVSVRLMEEPLKALQQSYLRTKVLNYEDFYEVMGLHTNSSNNTVFADAEGNIAYFHSNFIPRRDEGFNWNAPVDGSDPATEWGDLLSIDESPNVLNPPNGWIQNTNNWPYSAAGEHSPSQSDYPGYVQRSGENARGLHAIRVLQGKTEFTLQSLIDAAFDSYQTAFEPLIPALLRAYDRTPASNSLRTEVAEQISLLGDWDLRWGVDSVETSLAIYWATEMMGRARNDARSAGMSNADYIAGPASPAHHLEALAAASATLENDFGQWRTPWGDINRFQRLTGDIVQPFNDAGPSSPVGFSSSRWGSLASFGARTYPGTVKMYGTSGNSFVAVVEFGDRVSARAVTAGGESGDPASPHFNDQTERYATGDLREVYFYPDQLEGHVEREYHPGG